MNDHFLVDVDVFVFAPLPNFLAPNSGAAGASFLFALSLYRPFGPTRPTQTEIAEGRVRFTAEEIDETEAFGGLDSCSGVRCNGDGLIGLKTYDWKHLGEKMQVERARFCDVLWCCLL